MGSWAGKMTRRASRSAVRTLSTEYRSIRSRNRKIHPQVAFSSIKVGELNCVGSFCKSLNLLKAHPIYRSGGVMHLFRVRLILALIASVTLVSLASTYFDVLAHRHILREDLERRTAWMGRSIEPDVETRFALRDPVGASRSSGSPEVWNGCAGAGDLRRARETARGQRSTGRDGGAGARRCGEIAAEGRRGRRIWPRRSNGSGWRKHFPSTTATSWKAPWRLWWMPATSGLKESIFGGGASGALWRL